MNCPICDATIEEHGNMADDGYVICPNGCYFESHSYGIYHRLCLGWDKIRQLKLDWHHSESPEEANARDLLTKTFIEYLKFLKELER